MPYPAHDPQANAQRADSLRSRYLLAALIPADFDYWTEYDGEEFGNGGLTDTQLAAHLEWLMLKYQMNAAFRNAIESADPPDTTE